MKREGKVVFLISLLCLVLFVSALTLGDSYRNQIEISNNYLSQIQKLNTKLINNDNTVYTLKIENNELLSKLDKYNNIPIIFNSLDITIPSFASSLDIEQMLPNSMKGLGIAYYDAEQIYNVNALFMYALTALESSYGTSKIARERNNISSYMSYDGQVDTHSRYFNSKYECIMETAKLISEEYVSKDGKYYNGKSVSAINERYAKDELWKYKIINIAMKNI